MDNGVQGDSKRKKDRVPFVGRKRSGSCKDEGHRQDGESQERGQEELFG